MPDALFYLAIFFIIALVCALEPGPNFLLLARNAVARGRRHGFLTALGIHLGAYPAIILAATGMAALAAAVPSALYFIKIAGAAYLIWMGIRSFRDNPAPAETGPAGTSRSTAGRSFANGFVQVLLNPPSMRPCRSSSSSSSMRCRWPGSERRSRCSVWRPILCSLPSISFSWRRSTGSRAVSRKNRLSAAQSNG